MSERAARLVSVNVGMPHNVSWQGRTVLTGIWKEAVHGPREVRRLNVDGDGQGDRVGHGGEQRAVFVYQLQSYGYWSKELRRDDFAFGQFGENFTVDGLADEEVCIGDRYRIGSALFEVTQPRTTCYRVGIRLDEPRMAALLTGRGRPGFYFRVLEEGVVEAGDEIVLARSEPSRMTVATINALLYLDRRPDPELLRAALRIPALSPGWHTSMEALLDQQSDGRPGRRERGPGRTRAPAGVARLPRPASGRDPVRNSRGAVAGPRSGRGRPVGAPAAGPVRNAQARAGTGRCSARSELLVVGTARCSAIPDQRQDRTERSGRPAPSHHGGRR